MKKVIASLIIFYFLAVFQTSYLVLYEIKGAALNLVLLLIILMNFFEKKERRSGLLVGAIAGFYLDMFSPYFFGLFTLLGLAVAFLVKLLKGFFETNKVVSFVIVLFLSLLFYYLILAFIDLGCGFCFNVFNLIYNFLVGLIIYFLPFTFFCQKKVKGLARPIYALIQKGFNR